LAALIDDWPRLDGLADKGFVDDDLGIVKSGKEATVSLVERTFICDNTTVLLARKSYRFDRRFTRRDPYLEGAYAHRADLPYAMRLAEMRSGRAIAAWRSNESSTLRQLWHAGARVPYAFEVDELGDVCMQFLGCGRVAAPRLESVTPTEDQAIRWLNSLIDDLHVFVGLLLVHADLSPYNVLVHNDTPYVIDVPQAVRIGQAPNALALLHRDVQNLLDYFETFTTCPSVEDVMTDLMRHAPWRR